MVVGFPSLQNKRSFLFGHRAVAVSEATLKCPARLKLRYAAGSSQSLQQGLLKRGRTLFLQTPGRGYGITRAHRCDP